MDEAKLLEFGRTQNWNAEYTRAQFEPILGSDISSSPFDPDSVMNYVLPAGFFKNPQSTCVARFRAQPSALDLKGLDDTYRQLQTAAKLDSVLRTAEEDAVRSPSAAYVPYLKSRRQTLAALERR